MSTAAQIKATLAGRARKIALGYRQKSFLLSPGAQERLAELAKEAGSETKAVEGLLVGRGDPGFVEARDGLVGSRLVVDPATERLMARAEAFFGAWDGIVEAEATLDNPTKTLARQGKTRDTAVNKAAPKWVSAGPTPQPTKLTGPLDMDGNPLPHRGPTPKQPKVKK